MIPTTRTHRRLSGHTRPFAVALVALFALALPLPALAQDAVESPAPAVDQTGIDFPIMLGGQLLTTETFSGPEWVAQFSDGETEDAAFVEGTEGLVESVGKTLDDLTVKSALYEPSPGNHAVVAAFQIDGIDAHLFAEDAIHLLLGDVAMPELLLRPIDAKWALRVVDAEMPGVYPRTVYLKDDTAWIIEGDEEYVLDALDQLPDPEPSDILADDTLLMSVPLMLDGLRRTGVYEVTEPWALPTLEAHLSPEIEGWLVDLYLDAGLTPTEMLGVITWWGYEGQDSIQIEGYQLPGAAGTDAIERLRSDIFLTPDDVAAVGLPGEGDDPFAELLDPPAPEHIEQELGGREVTTIDYGDVQQHIFISGDTVWVVTDPAGEAELAEKAIAALP